MKYQLYLFDFDYTLADSSKGIVHCFQQVLAQHGFAGITDYAIKRTIGKSLEASFEILTGVSDEVQLAAFKHAYVKEADQFMTRMTYLYPEVEEVMVALKAQGARLGIISTKYRYRIEEFLSQYFSPGFFELVIGGEDVSLPKPSPEGIHQAMARLNVIPTHVLYLGDSVVDAEAAESAGVDFAGVLHGMTLADELAEYPNVGILSDLSGLVVC